ncbi:MAG: GNAT family N-acetyltransferase [Hyphomonadaceae bacterium]|nr:GNAT family N-acetyltransferase [Hyphomonadaceae bacterium]
MDEIKFRFATSDDFDELGQVMFDAIHNGPTKYTKAQSKAWAPAPRSGPAWAERLRGKQILIAKRGDRALGFMSIEAGGYVDFAYIRPQAQGTGLFRKLYDQIEARAVEMGETELSTHASLMAQPAFESMGFDVVYHETVDIDGQQLDRARMSKTL